MLLQTKRRTTRRKPARSSARSRPARKPAARQSRARAEARAAFERLEQRHLDLAGLALIALGIFMAFVTYLDWNGGPVGGWLETGLTLFAGRISYLAPLALAGWGVALIMRPVVKAPSALNAGAVLVLGALLLAFAAGTAGLGPTHPLRHGYFDHRFMTQHGGAGGEALYWASTSLFQRLGAQILAVLMLVSGTLLLTGTTVSSLLARVGTAARRAGTSTREMAQTVRTQAALDPFGDREGGDIAITRANPTEPLLTDALEPPDGEDWYQEPSTELERSGEQFAYEEATGDDEAELEPPIPLRPRQQPEAAAEPEPEVTPMGVKRSSVTESEELEYVLPAPKLLEKGKGDQGPDTRDRDSTSKALLESLQHFGVEARLTGVVSGPHVSRYELQLAPGTKVSKVAQLKDDLAYALASTDIRILAPIPGKKAVGVEVPNARRRLVRLGDIYEGRPKGSSPFVVWLGKDVSGQAAWTDLALMPHALVAGTTGSGKSGCINSMLCSVLLHASPNEARLVLVDPKRVELNHYERLPHLLTPVVTNPRMAANVLANLIGEMESRYQVMEEARARNLVELNRTRRRAGQPSLPHILCVIDELADLMMVAPAEVEDSIIRLAQKSRAVGIHLVLATQRPSTDVITGTIKVNIPARIAFAVASQVDSRVI
ncbi:MAG: segregation ATPase FtsK/SpoIIIE, family, partial [Solirubrobacterales bacterium]|nr:segregation ATPase FtsK/SpoIIIE, family [Solirubrobacterales bacterium]